MDYLAVRTDQPIEYDSRPEDIAQYSKASFWDARYIKNPEVFEWYLEYRELERIFDDFMDLGDEILVVGCGNSALSADMALQGFDFITNIDFSTIVISQMKEKYAEDLPDMPWFYMDSTKLRFDDHTFDVVIDKGCLDSVLCGDKGRFQAQKMLQEIDRVLKPDGAYILITYGTPDARLELLENDDIESPDFLTWDTFVNAFPKPSANNYTMTDYGDLASMYYIYVCIKEERKVTMKLKREEKRKRMEKKKGRLQKGRLVKKGAK
mmetsp:Transcript_10806/g.14024  ORF Transcript_10806/g.14024 Transcript_10806/m.14024 type:complete len:265 (-) Transcript_10806:579-1373(-)|eukprot:CAMPEP_0117738992 /NCGR_PEP_ID=MMETSP0947-20121206/3471_1 /TAXON_ID=44440 /ORGANISM="Chattonella subsalsa, Strain CCMP2191" /LENGTH=264 /DNA_ID=CAMNT_0005554811 /DNA_START=1 /DNA_END=795 /DNA_ORIENTATION=-